MDYQEDKSAPRVSPFWIDDCPRPADLTSQPLPSSADVVVVGAGYTGLNAGRVLASSGANVVVVDQRVVGFGASGRNGGFLPTGMRVPTPKLIKMYGVEMSRRLWQISLDAISLVEQVVASESIECHFRRFGQLKLALKASHLKEMSESAAWHEREFGHVTKVLSPSDLRDEVGSTRFVGGVLDEAVAGLHPAKYVFGLARAYLRHGGRLCENTEVTGITRSAAGFTVATNQGTITTKEVVFATNGYTGSVLPELRARIFPGGSFVIVTEPLPKTLQQELCPRERILIDSKKLLSYFRLTPDGRMLWGGQNRFEPDFDPTEMGHHLRSEMAGVFPQLKDIPITHAWSGRLGLTFDLMPHIGRIEGIHYALGYCGRGVAVASYLGTEVGLMLTGKKSSSPFAEIPHKKMFFYRDNPWFLPLLGAAYRTIDALP